MVISPEKCKGLPVRKADFCNHWKTEAIQNMNAMK
jgi:hypothetical protein